MKVDIVETKLETAPKAVIFDWDNTLVNTWPVIHRALHGTFAEYGLTPWTLEETKSRVAHSLRDFFPKLFGDKWEEAGKAYHRFYMTNHLADLHVLAHAEEVLRYLHDKGVYLALVSNKKGPTLREEVEHLGWGHYFRKIVGSGDAAQDKPDPAPVHMALEGSGITPGEQVWFVGDTAVDLEVACRTGCVPVLYGEAVAETMPDGTLRYQSFDLRHHSRDHANLLDLLSRVID